VSNFRFEKEREHHEHALGPSSVNLGYVDVVKYRLDGLEVEINVLRDAYIAAR
jgi:hypothetical protein